MLEDYLDYVDQHEDYILLMEEYSNSEIFKEIILFMDIAFPEWKTNKGIGFYAAEFILFCITNNEYLEFEYSINQEKLVNLYIALDDAYHQFEDDFRIVSYNEMVEQVETEHEEDLLLVDENPTISVADYMAYYKALKDQFSEEFMKIVTYDFKTNIL